MTLGVLYDGQVYSYMPAGGIRRYYANVIGRLPDSVRPVLTLHRPLGAEFPRHRNLEVLRADGLGPPLLARQVAARQLRRAGRRAAPDIAHPTYYSLTTGRSLADYEVPVVVTVWDMIHERFAADLDPAGVVARLKETAVRAADRVICISESTRQDVLDRYGLDESRLVVTPLATDLDASMADGPEPVPQSPYFLYVGSREHGYKNFWRAAEALAELRRERPGAALAVVGAPLTVVERGRLSGLDLGSAIKEFPAADDRHLAKLYRHAVALVYPSLYEGFGIPPLEAMACGTAVIAGNVASLPEVVGDAGILVDPASAQELAGAMLALFDDAELREDLIARGGARVAEFDWGRTATQTLAVYRLLSGG